MRSVSEMRWSDCGRGRRPGGPRGDAGEGADLSREQVAHHGIPADAGADSETFHHIACCIDDSPAALGALMTAAGLRDRTGGSLTAVHALRAPDEGESAAAARRLLAAAAHRGVVARLVLGSLARHLTHRAPCSVLLVRRREAAVEPS